MKCIDRAGIVLHEQTALGQRLLQLEIRWIHFCCNFQLLGGRPKLLRSVVAHAQQRSRLYVFRICSQRRAKRCDRCLELAELEEGQTKIELDSRQLRIKCE